MYLKKLEIFGFKSFANRTIVNFTKGITGIVGPNGCGKTNIVDAIRWSLGEQKSSTLRSDKMENVIFNGTRNKKPMGMAEVSLTLENDKGVLPTEYSEVKITRRIFRSGESEYLLNGNLCRLKDITSMFMDTGMGTNAYSVIELKMIETILSNRADERRNMFEEAAGVNKYKLRRRLSLKKLDSVKADLHRVNDIVSEVEKKVNSLERQAKKADKHNQLSTLLREKELDLANREFSLFSNQNATFGLEKQELSKRKDEIDLRIHEVENDLIVFRAKLSEVETELSTKRKELNIQNEKLHSAQRNISVAQERKNAMEKNIERFKRELEELKIQLDENEELILENNDVIFELSDELNTKQTQLKDSPTLIDEKKKKLEEKKIALKTQSDSVIEKIKIINSKENTLSTLKKNLEKGNAILEKLNNKIISATENIAKTASYLEDLSNEKHSCSEKLESAEKNYQTKQNEKEQLENKLNELRENEFHEKSVLMQLKNKIDFLKSLIDNLEGVHQGSKVLLENNEWCENDKSIFSDIGNTDEKYRFAIEAALKLVINDLLIENLSDLKNAINYLKENNLGKASFFLLKNSEEKKGLFQKIFAYKEKKKTKKIISETGFIDFAINLVTTDEKWKPYFEKVLNKTIVVESLDIAIELSKKYPGFNFASLEGDYVLNNGIIEAGSAPKPEQTLFGRKQMLTELEKDLPALEIKLAELKNEIEKIENHYAQIDLKTLAEDVKLFSNELTNIEKQISQIEFEKTKADEEIENTRNEISELISETDAYEFQIRNLELEIKNLTDEKNTEEELLKNLEFELKEIEISLSAELEIETKKKLEIEKIKGNLKNAEAAIKRAEQNQITIKQTIQKREREIENTTAELYAIDSIIEDSQIEYDEYFELHQKLSEEENEINEKLKLLKSDASKYERDLQSIRKEREIISDKIHEIDLQINKISMKLEALTAHIREEYNLELEIMEFDDLDNFDYTERHSEVTNLKNKLKNLGPINLLAYSEFEEENERLQFLHQQRNDLIESEKDLIKTIQEINETAQNLFKETFEVIRENFVKIFRTLFNPGDEADLRLEEDVDPLEAKIEIIAKPKGKRPTSIELLSGGEKTLTATALLFAIYLVKPSPFCILDEVDAPLDDANVDRFTRLIKEFSDNTQFIMVTHNKRTMEAAENMYGVTMQAEGISKLVAVQFNEDLASA